MDSHFRQILSHPSASNGSLLHTPVLFEPWSRVWFWSLLIGGLLFAHAAYPQFVKANNSDGLDQASSWVGNTVPGGYDPVEWDHSVTGPTNIATPAYSMFGSIAVADPGGDVTLGGNITLGNGFIDMSASTANLTILGYVMLQSKNANITVGSGSALTLNGGLSFGVIGYPNFPTDPPVTVSKFGNGSL